MGNVNLILLQCNLAQKKPWTFEPDTPGSKSQLCHWLRMALSFFTKKLVIVLTTTKDWWKDIEGAQCLMYKINSVKEPLLFLLDRHHLIIAQCASLIKCLCHAWWRIPLEPSSMLILLVFIRSTSYPLKWLGMDWESLIKFVLPDYHLPVLYSISPKNSIDPTWL